MTSENTPRPVTARSCAWPDCGCAVPIKCPLQQEADAGGGLVERLRELTPEITGKSYYWGKLIKEAADTIESLRREKEKYLMLSAQHARLCEQVYEEDGETLKQESLRRQVAELQEANARYSLASNTGAIDDLWRRAERAEAERDASRQAQREAETHLAKELARIAMEHGGENAALLSDAKRYRRIRENWIDCDELGLHGRLAVVDAIVDNARKK